MKQTGFFLHVPFVFQKVFSFIQTIQSLTSKYENRLEIKKSSLCGQNQIGSFFMKYCYSLKLSYINLYHFNFVIITQANSKTFLNSTVLKLLVKITLHYPKYM